MPTTPFPTAGALTPHGGSFDSLPTYARGVVGAGNAEPPEDMPRASLRRATEPRDTVTGRVTYSQQILMEFGWIDEARGGGVDRPGSGFSQV